MSFTNKVVQENGTQVPTPAKQNMFSSATQVPTPAK